jgi:hypothetical protein
MNTAAAVDYLLQMARHVKISRHQPGRIRLQLQLGALTLLEQGNPEDLLQVVPGIEDVRAQLIFGNVTIFYDPRRLPPDVWEAMVSLQERPEKAPQVRARLENLLDRDGRG